MRATFRVPRSLPLATLWVLLCAPFAGCGGDEFSASKTDGGSTGGSGGADASLDSSAGGKSGGKQDAGSAGGAGKAGSAGSAGAAGDAGAAGSAGAAGNAGGQPDACVPETVQELCAGHQATCGGISGIDKCGNSYAHNCGACACGQDCSNSNQCVAKACSVSIGQEGCSCDGECCGGICAGGTCCIDNGHSCGSGTQCGENTNCCSGQCNGGQCWGAELNCTP